MDQAAHLTVTASSHPKDSDNNALLDLPSFNFLLPTRPNTPWHLDDPTYLEFAGLLESCIVDQDPTDLTPPSGQSTDNITLLETISGPSWIHEISDTSPVPSRRESLEQRIRGAYRRIFAILIMIGNQQETLIFINNNITDLDLPFVKVLNTNKGRYELRRRTEPHKPLEYISEWSSWTPHCSWIGNSDNQEIQRQPSSVTKPASCDGSILDMGPMWGGSWELPWDLPEAETRATYPSGSSISDGKGSTSLSDVHSSATSPSTSNLSRRQVSITQTTQDTNLEQPRHVHYFACPFFKHNASRYARTCSKGWIHIHRLKEHLYRRHLLPKHKCTRCLAYFEDAAGLETHTRSVTPCVLTEAPHVEGISPEQERRLRSRKRTRTDTTSDDVDRDCERWREMYKIIFPETNPGRISPYTDYNHLDSTTSGAPETVADYSKFLNEGIPSDVQTELQITISRELGLSEVDARKIIDIIPMLQQTLLKSFQYQRGNSAQ